MSNIYSNIFLLDNIDCLSVLDEIFKREHKELLQHVKKDEIQVSRMPDSEKHFIYSWEEIGEVEEVKVPEIEARDHTSEKTILFQKAVANVEYSKRKKKDDQGNFLPKAERVNDSDVDLMFFEKEQQVYVLILTSNDYNISRVLSLIGDEHISSMNHEYSLEANIFNWLFYVYTERDGVLSPDTSLENISGFVGNVTDDANVFTGTSHQTTELIVTKAFISNGGELKKIKLRVRDADVDITCMVNENSSAVVFTNLSTKLRLLDGMDKPTFLLMYLYGYLILRLKQLYSKDSAKFIEEDNPNFSKKIGIDVIQSIIEKNNIGFEDIEDFFVSTIYTERLIK